MPGDGNSSMSVSTMTRIGAIPSLFISIMLYTGLKSIREKCACSDHWVLNTTPELLLILSVFYMLKLISPHFSTMFEFFIMPLELFIVFSIITLIIHLQTIKDCECHKTWTMTFVNLSLFIFIIAIIVSGVMVGIEKRNLIVRGI